MAGIMEGQTGNQNVTWETAKKLNVGFDLGLFNDVVEFEVEAPSDISFTLEMEPSTEYKLVVDGVSAGRIPTNVGGKLNASLSLNEGAKSSVKIVKC